MHDLTQFFDEINPYASPQSGAQQLPYSQGSDGSQFADYEAQRQLGSQYGYSEGVQAVPFNPYAQQGAGMLNGGGPSGYGHSHGPQPVSEARYWRQRVWLTTLSTAVFSYSTTSTSLLYRMFLLSHSIRWS